MNVSLNRTGRIIKDLSALLLKEMELCASEQRCPGMSADQSDAKIRDCKQRIKELREIREQVEITMTGVLL